MTPEQKQQILRDAPEGASHYSPNDRHFYKLNTVGTLLRFTKQDSQWDRLYATSLNDVCAISLDSLREPEQENWSEEDEKRQTLVDQNGNSAEHYEEVDEYIVIQCGIDSGPFTKSKAHEVANKWAETTPGKPAAVCRVMAVYRGKVEVERVK